jgi:uncharacterized protein YdhG (YjbR/CyaY superfamily)
MRTDQTAPTTIDEYIARCPAEFQEDLEKIRKRIRAAAPGAQETIEDQMPTFTLNGHLVQFAALKEHIGFYPTPTGIEAFRAELSDYDVAEDGVRFRLDQAIPFGLISRMVQFRVKENQEHLTTSAPGIQ